MVMTVPDTEAGAEGLGSGLLLLAGGAATAEAAAAAAAAATAAAAAALRFGVEPAAVRVAPSLQVCVWGGVRVWALERL